MQTEIELEPLYGGESNETKAVGGKVVWNSNFIAAPFFSAALASVIGSDGFSTYNHQQIKNLVLFGMDRNMTVVGSAISSCSSDCEQKLCQTLALPTISTVLLGPIKSAQDSCGPFALRASVSMAHTLLAGRVMVCISLLLFMALFCIIFFAHKLLVEYSGYILSSAALAHLAGVTCMLVPGLALMGDTSPTLHSLCGFCLPVFWAGYFIASIRDIYSTRMSSR